MEEQGQVTNHLLAILKQHREKNVASLKEGIHESQIVYYLSHTLHAWMLEDYRNGAHDFTRKTVYLHILHLLSLFDLPCCEYLMDQDRFSFTTISLTMRQPGAKLLSYYATSIKFNIYRWVFRDYNVDRLDWGGLERKIVTSSPSALMSSLSGFSGPGWNWHGYYFYNNFEMPLSLDGFMDTELTFTMPASSSSSSMNNNSPDHDHIHSHPHPNLAPPPPALNQSEDIMVTGTGDDDIGLFTMNGTINPRDMTFLIRKEYEGPSIWIYTGIVDEYGLCGSWGDNQWGGPFRLWPRPPLGGVVADPPPLIL
eukprot:TRINITY_DN8036_c0_g2_i1.p1 TRINITY_DN8036_c0_g2~~TRINITY_DN8036_c0_g2_i1.p1  ORF type:complete len:310 (+),score=55.79 TRINITY_DN8036_c0_g2_i1:259-1188(+)